MKELLEKLYLEERKEVKEIALILDKTNGQVRRLLQIHGLEGSKGRNKSNVDESTLKEDNLVLWYYIGLIASDGYIKPHKSGHYSIRLTIKNKGSYDLLNNIAKNLGYTNKVRQYKNNFNELEIVNNRLLSIINACGVPLINKTFDLDFPKDLTEGQARMYIRGCFDGDGSVSVRTNNNWGGTFKMISASKLFITGFTLELNKWLEITKEAIVSGNVFELSLNVKESIKVFDWMYEGFEEFRLEYKYNKYITRKLYKESDDYYSKSKRTELREPTSNKEILNINIKNIIKVDDIV